MDRRALRRRPQAVRVQGGFTDEEEALEYGQAQLYEIRHGLHVSKRAGAVLMTDWLDEWLAALDHAHLTEKSYRRRAASYTG
ncbi:hypothetical protein ACFWY6_21300 [Streptomyces sp. NPDC059037]|uniref:hypothetical protein n=1 Tax=Streptomyces sp. NPDC059037 TaxID=3346710 RepID=UPI0036890951